MKYLLITLLALIVGGFVGRMIWGEKKPEPVDPVQVIVTQIKTHAIIEHERQLAIWYRACPEVLGKTPQIFIAWPAKLSYELELGDVQITREGTVIKVKTSSIHPDEPSVPTDFVDYLSTTSIFTFANEQELVNHEVAKASPIARYLTTYFLANDPSLRADFVGELQSLVEHLAGALGVPVTEVDVEIPKVEIAQRSWPKLPKLELCAGSLAAVNGMPFAKVDDGYTVPIRFNPPPSARSSGGRKPTPGAAAPADAPKGDGVGVSVQVTRVIARRPQGDAVTGSRTGHTATRTTSRWTPGRMLRPVGSSRTSHPVGRHVGRDTASGGTPRLG